MARKNLPAWQQVVLTALENVPKAKNGRDAWEKLAPEEQSAVMDFLKEHCGEDAQAKLDETCAMVKHGRGWQTTWGIFWGLLILAVYIGAAFWLENHLRDFYRYLWVVLCLRQTIRAWNGDRQGTMQTIWREHITTQNGTAIALQDMHRTLGLPREKLCRKRDVIWWAVLGVLWIAMIVFDILW